MIPMKTFTSCVTKLNLQLTKHVKGEINNTVKGILSSFAFDLTRSYLLTNDQAAVIVEEVLKSINKVHIRTVEVCSSNTMQTAIALVSQDMVNEYTFMGNWVNYGFYTACSLKIDSWWSDMSCCGLEPYRRLDIDELSLGRDNNNIRSNQYQH
jgi:hypothetical protein